MFDGAETLRKLTMATLRVTGLTKLARPFLGGIGVILMLHRVTAAPARPLDLNGHLSVRPDFLDAVLADMKEAGYRFVSMDEAVRLIREPDGGTPFATITLDDGYRDNLLEALPVFEKHETPFAIYIAPGLIGQYGNLWWEVVEDAVTVDETIEVPHASDALRLDAKTLQEKKLAFRTLIGHFSADVTEAKQRELIAAMSHNRARRHGKADYSVLMDWDEIRIMAAHPLATIGAHTVNHYALKRLDLAHARAEMKEAACILEGELGTRPIHMAYPYGFKAAVDEREAEIAAEVGFVSAVTTRHGLIHPEHAAHLHALPRLSLNGRYQSLGHVRTMLSGLTAAMANRGRRVVTM